jgi:hypothetical protein
MFDGWRWREGLGIFDFGFKKAEFEMRKAERDFYRRASFAKATEALGLRFYRGLGLGRGGYP